ncbi:Mu-like prophage protein gp16 [Rheinheimera pacifica]|uniref:Mu-like prophage protein gp16 n=1 Tax=Rheinheimera pacifica TaxID=173990 RepID=A0A1H6KD20_9GAMM|nr:regulatory protein GemA [Rheinheimera pacifica]SEH73112.1 Mu-like prophage protein gp16 [Rheinheimera pacifica]
MTYITEKARRSGVTAAAEQRRTLISMIHIARTQLGMDEDSYRANLAHYAKGKTSCSQLTVPELFTVLEAFKDLGFKPTANKRLSPRTADGPKGERSAIRALWIFMHRAGFIEDGSEAALNAWVQRMTAAANDGTGIAEVQWLRGEDAARTLNSLKRWARRCLFENLKKRGYQPDPKDSYKELLQRWERINGAML